MRVPNSKNEIGRFSFNTAFSFSLTIHQFKFISLTQNSTHTHSKTAAPFSLYKGRLYWADLKQVVGMRHSLLIGNATT
jgi:hypothetical protein